MSYDMFRLRYFFILSVVDYFVTENSSRTLIDMADPQKNTLQYGAAECAISSNLSIRETCSIQFLVAIYSIYSFDIIFDIFGSKILGPSHFHHQRRLQKSLPLLGSSTRSHVAKVISLLAGYHHPSLSRVFPLGSSWFAHEG